MLDFLLGLRLWQLTVVVLAIALVLGVGFSVGIQKISACVRQCRKPTLQSI